MTKDEHSTLEIPPRRSIDDPGAHELSSDSDDHFSDAQSGLEAASGKASPIPITRIEKVDNEPSYGEVPGTEGYHMREEDAEPDQIAIIGGGQRSEISSPFTPGGQPIPTTVVEKVDDIPSHGEVPGTVAHEQRAADAVPDVVMSSQSRSRSPSLRTPITRSRAGSTPGDLPIPTTKVEKIDSEPSHGEVPGTDAYALRTEDAKPDEVVDVSSAQGSPTLPSPRSSELLNEEPPLETAKDAALASDDYNEEEDGSEGGGFGDDFDDFEEGEEDAEFGDFDDGFQEAAVAAPIPQSIPVSQAFPVLDFSSLTTSEALHAATEPYLNALFPPDTIDNSILPNPDPTTTSSSTQPQLQAQNTPFTTPRITSLWTQLIAPPPLHPPNWIRSRIRRLFLISLGVPIDLDEILPASKQKKLILYLSPPTSSTPRTSSSITRLKPTNASSTSLDSSSGGGGKRSQSASRRRGKASAPHLDLVAARQMCDVTTEALNGFTDEELRAHVGRLEEMKGIADEVLVFWTGRTDELLGDREAFEGVIENLVKHARKVRK